MTALAMPTAPACAPSDAAAFVSDALARLRTGALGCVTVPAPVAPIETLLRYRRDADASLWAPPTGPQVAGIGLAVRFDADSVRSGAAALWTDIDDVAYPGTTAPTMRLFGGFAFAPGAADEPQWAAFGDGSFALPRWRYAVHGGAATLTLACRAGDATAAAETAELLRALAAPPVATAATRVVRTIAEQPLAPWAEQIDAIRDAIASGSHEKIVAARRTVVQMDARIDEVAVLERLGARYPNCFRYGVRTGGASFVGATPERLVGKRGASLDTEALAGSIDAVACDAGDALRASHKDLAEHEFVVRAIVDQLEPLCDRVDVPTRPEICALRHVLHLRTPIHGHLRGEPHVLDLVDALHPTPAVGGVPTSGAVEWISARELDARGWYAGPIGWFDAAGDGEFAVALRSGLLVGEHAYVYVGAGIVSESDAVAEYEETGLKQRALFGALGVTDE